MIETKETHDKIVSVLKEKGPSLPINVAKVVGMSSLFVSAFLSEMVGEKKIRVSHLKVGGSPLYFLEGQENRLEDFFKYLPSREADAFLMLKERKVLKDAEQEPAIRVALRSIKDFSVGFKKGDEIFWKYVSVSDNEIREILGLNEGFKKEPVKEQGEESVREEVRRESIRKEVKEIIDKVEGSVVEKSISVESQNEFHNPLAVSEKPKNQKLKSDFVLNVLKFFNEKGFKIIKERDYKVKEYNGIVQIRSELGPINFLTQAKDKKSISEIDLKKLLSVAQSIPLPAFMIYTGDLSKNAKECLNKYVNILKVKKLV